MAPALLGLGRADARPIFGGQLVERAESTTHSHATEHDERTRFDEAWSELDHALTSGGLDLATEVARRRWFDLLEGPDVPERFATGATVLAGNRSFRDRNESGCARHLCSARQGA